MATNDGRRRRAHGIIAAALQLPVSASTRNRSGASASSAQVVSPTEPVAPRTLMLRGSLIAISILPNTMPR